MRHILAFDNPSLLNFRRRKRMKIKLFISFSILFLSFLENLVSGWSSSGILFLINRNQSLKTLKYAWIVSDKASSCVYYSESPNQTNCYLLHIFFKYTWGSEFVYNYSKIAFEPKSLKKNGLLEKWTLFCVKKLWHAKVWISIIFSPEALRIRSDNHQIVLINIEEQHNSYLQKTPLKFLLNIPQPQHCCFTQQTQNLWG